MVTVELLEEIQEAWKIPKEKHTFAYVSSKDSILMRFNSIKSIQLQVLFPLYAHDIASEFFYSIIVCLLCVNFKRYAKNRYYWFAHKWFYAYKSVEWFWVAWSLVNLFVSLMALAAATNRIENSYSDASLPNFSFLFFLVFYLFLCLHFGRGSALLSMCLDTLAKCCVCRCTRCCVDSVVESYKQMDSNGCNAMYQNTISSSCAWFGLV